MSNVGKQRGEYAKTASRRSGILDATMAVFAGSGFRGGSIRDIAERVGISQAGLLHHFSSKNELLEAVLDHRDELARARMGGDMPTGLELVRAVVELTDYNATEPGLVALFTVLSAEATAPDHPAHEYFRDRYRWLMISLRDAFALAQERGQVKPDVIPEVAARTLIAISDGMQVQWLYEDFAVDMTGPARSFVNPLLVAPPL